MDGWRTGEVLGLDTETTGVDVRTDRMLSAALVTRTQTGTEVRTWLVDPGVAVPPAASAVNGLTTELVRGAGTAPTPALEEIADQLADALRRGVPVIAYNAAFDLVLLDNELTRHGRRRIAERAGLCRPVVDPLVLDRALDPGRDAPRTLGDLCAHYGVSSVGLHTADADVRATLEVLDAIAAAYPLVDDLTPASLHAWQTDRYREWAEDHNARLAVEHRRPVDPAWPVPLALAAAG